MVWIQDLPLHWNQADVGCDFWKWTPIDIDTLISYCKIKKEEMDRLTGMLDKLRRSFKNTIKTKYGKYAEPETV